MARGSSRAQEFSGCGPKQDFSADGELVRLLLVEGPPASALIHEGTCVVQTNRLTPDEAYHYGLSPAPDVFRHIGESIAACLDGTATVDYSGGFQPFFRQDLWINYDGVCQPEAVACYYPSNPTIDRAQAFAVERAEYFEAQLVGHEVWHAVAGRFHP
jgi:hypothetical protein